MGSGKELMKMEDKQYRLKSLTFQRLVSAGYTEEQAKDKIADVLAVHIVYATSFGRPFHPEEYEKELNQLK